MPITRFPPYTAISHETKYLWLIAGVSGAISLFLVALAIYRLLGGYRVFTSKAFKRGSTESQFWIATIGVIVTSLIAITATWFSHRLHQDAQRFWSMTPDNIGRIEIYRTRASVIDKENIIPRNLLKSVAEHGRIKAALDALADSAYVPSNHQDYQYEYTVKLVIADGKDASGPRRI